jgi:membrane-associated phospholipid phosphatase
VSRRRERGVGTWLGLAGLSAALLAALYLVAVHTATGQRLDERSFGRLDERANERTFEATARLLDTISIASVALIGGAIVLLATLRRRRDLAVAAAVVMLGANVTTQVLKAALPRPGLVPSLVPEGSLPSGHTTVAISLALALVLVVPTGTRLLAGVVGGTYAVGVGVATIALDWHRPSDVAAAYLVAAAWTAVAGAALCRRRDAPAGVEAPGPGRRAGAALAALAAAFVVTLGVAAAVQVDVLQVVDDRTAFLAAAAAVAAVGAAVVAAITGLLIRSSPAAL